MGSNGFGLAGDISSVGVSELFLKRVIKFEDVAGVVLFWWYTWRSIENSSHMENRAMI